MKISDILNLQNSVLESKTDNLIKAFGTGYFISPDGKLHSFKGMTHEEWAEKSMGATVEGLISQGWVRARTFGDPAMNYTQGDGLRIADVRKVIEIAERDGKTQVRFWTKKNRIVLHKQDGEWKDEDGKSIDDILLTESKNDCERVD